MRRWLVASCTVLAALLSGCWSRIEVNDIAVVIGMGVDVGEREPLRVTLYVARGSMATTGKQVGGESVWVVAREASNLSDAVRKIGLASSRRISLHHVRVILVGEELARKGIEPLEDFVGRNPQIRLTSRPFVVRGRADTVFETPPQLRATQPSNIAETIYAATMPDHRLRDFLISRSALTHSGWMHGLQVIERPVGLPESPETAVQMNGVALFFGDKLVHWLDHNDAQALYWLIGHPRSLRMVSSCPDSPSRTFASQVVTGSTKITPRLSGGQVVFTVAVSGKVELTNMDCEGTISQPGYIQRLEGEVSRDVKERIRRFVAAVQAKHLDPVGFGKRVQLGQTAYWQRAKGDWPAIWSNARVQITVDVQVHNAGMLIQPANRTQEELSKVK